MDGSPNFQVSEKPNNVNSPKSHDQPTVSRTLPSNPILEPTKRRILPSIPVNEIRKVQQKPRRVLPCLPPIVQEILRWSIHPEEVLRGAVSVSHVLNLPTIKEENALSVQSTVAKMKQKVPRVKRILPSVPPTANRTLPSNQPTAAVRKPLPKFRADFKKKMLPSLSTIEEQTSPKLAGVEIPEESQESAENEAVPEVPGLTPADENAGLSEQELQSIKKRKKKKHRRSKRKVRENQNSLQSAENEAMDDFKLVNRQSSESTMVQELPRSPSGRGRRVHHPRAEETVVRVQRKAKRQSESKEPSINHEQTVEKKTPRPPTKEKTQANLQRRQTNKELSGVHPKMNQTHPSLISAHSYESEEMPNLRAKLARRSKTVFQPCAKDRNVRPPSNSKKQALPSIAPAHEAVISKPTSNGVPTLTRMLPTENRPLPSIRPTQELLVPKPPSTPKGPPSARPFVTRARPKIRQASVNRPLPSILPTQEPRIPKPPSTPKRPPSARPFARRARPKENRPLPSIQPVEEETLSSLSSSSQQNLVKFPLPSVHRDESNYHSAAGTVHPTLESNFQPLAKESERSSQGKMPCNERQ